MSNVLRGAIIRAEAATAVDAVVRGGQSLDAALAAAASRLAAADRPLFKALCYGTVRHHWRLAAKLERLLKRPLKARDQVIHALLLIGIYQLTDTRVSAHAAVSLTVEAARLLRRPNMKGLVNGVLRNYLRNPPNVDDGPDEVRFDHPRWLIARLKADWPDRWQAILDANNARAPMWLRVDPARYTAAAYLDVLRDANAPERPAGELLAGLEQAVRLDEPRPVDDLPGFAAGAVSVQDAAAQLAAPWLLRDGGRRILDACAAPGGKTGHLLELAGTDATLTAVDSDRERMVRVRETLERLGREATVLVGDASQPQEWWDSRPFDRILLDAPCSASGVIRRHPDIKHLRRPSDLESLETTQAALLDACWSMLAPGGRLLYVTCSVLRQENDGVVGAFLRRRADVQVNNVLPNNNIHDLMSPTTCGFQILPGTRGMDGFYYACLERRA